MGIADVKLLTQWLPACESGRHVVHPMETCDEYEAFAATVRAHLERCIASILAAPQTAIHDVPAALRGPNWTAAVSP